MSEILHISPFKLKLNKDNPRFIRDEKFEKLCKSLREFPEMLEKRPIIVDEERVALGGNMKLRAAREIGAKKVPYIMAEGWSEEKKQEFVVKDNLHYGEWNHDLLTTFFDTDHLIEWGMDIDFQDQDIEDILEIDDFNKSVNFIVKCEDLDELEEIKHAMKTEANQIDAKILLGIIMKKVEA